MSHTNYNRISNEKLNGQKDNSVPETKAVETTNPEVEASKMPETINKPEFIFGTVINCEKLNVREDAHLDAPIICTINRDTKVLIIPEESTDKWYKVDIGGQQGFCMKQYMTTNE